MRETNQTLRRVLQGAALAVASLACATAQASAPGITGPTFNLRAGPAYITQPDGASVYSWGYGCSQSPSGFMQPLPAMMANQNCPDMQIPGPTLIVNQGDTVTVNLTNNLPAAAGNTSILFPGFSVATSGGTAGVLAQEAAVGSTVTYTFTATTPGTHSYYSGTRGDVQIEMGLYGAIIVLPTMTPAVSAVCNNTRNDLARAHDFGNGVETDWRNAKAAYNHPEACYDREYLFQFSEMDPKIHQQAQDQSGLACTNPNGCMQIETEPYHPAYYLINGRSMPDDMDPNYSVQYPHQPYNGNPHMHPGELTLLRIIGQGRWQHPFHEHANHVRVLARDGNLILSANDPQAATNGYTRLAGPLLFTTTTTPGQAMDGIFYWTGKGLNWDVFGHGYAGDTSVCTPDANGYHSVATDPNYYEWCGDHRKPLEAKPFGQVGSGGPATLPDPNIVANGAWYSGSVYLGPEALARAVGSTPIPPSGTIANDPGQEAGFAYMWHSHNEREITTNNIFPGGMFMMMLVDPRAFVIDESK